MPFKFLEHTADVLFEASGKDFQSALESAADALSFTIGENVKKTVEFEIEESANNLEELVVFVLSDLLKECEIREVLVGGLKVNEFDEENKKIKATGWGGDGKRKTIVKAVTYHLLKIEKNKECKMRILLDV